MATEHIPSENSATIEPGKLLARGVCRYLTRIGMAVLEEFVPERGLRVDVMALAQNGELWVIECKSSRADFVNDQKWQGYLAFADRFFWAVSPDFPREILPDSGGLILADSYDAEIIRPSELTKLAAARRKKLVQKFARDAAIRLQALRDPKAPTL